MKVSVLEIKDMNAPDAKTTGSLRAYATIQVGPLVIYKVRLIKQPGAKAYVSPPQFEYLDTAGKRQYFPVLKWPEEWKAPVLEAVWSAYQQQRPDTEN